MTKRLGEMVEAAQKARGWGLEDVCALLEERGYGRLGISMLQRMEKGNRPGVPAVWGGLWKIFGLPLRDLYEELGLPVADALPSGTSGAILSVVSQLPWQAQEMVLAFARHTPLYLGVVGTPTQAESPVERAKRLADELMVLVGETQLQAILQDARNRQRTSDAPMSEPVQPAK